MYIVSTVLVSPACALLWFAWTNKIGAGRQGTQPRWRGYSMVASLIAASVAPLAWIGFVVSWFHNGGSPHGLTPPPGLWKTFGPIFSRALIASVVLAIFGKGKPRAYTLGWAAAILVALSMTFILEMD